MTACKSQNDSIKSSDTNYIYNFCRQQIQKAVTLEDFLPMIKLLIPMHRLKDKLSETVDALHDSSTALQVAGSPQDESIRTKSNPNDRGGVHKLKQLYLNSSSISEIFSNSILMNIIRFIPPQQFDDVSRVSSHFRELMVENIMLHSDYEMTIDKSLNGISICFKQPTDDMHNFMGSSKPSSIRFNVPADRFYCILQIQ